MRRWISFITKGTQHGQWLRQISSQHPILKTGDELSPTPALALPALPLIRPDASNEFLGPFGASVVPLFRL